MTARRFVVPVAFASVAAAVVGWALYPAIAFDPSAAVVFTAVDHRFDRARYDGQRTTDAFAERMRNEVDLGTIRASLAATANAAVRPTGSSLWLRSRGPS